MTKPSKVSPVINTLFVEERERREITQAAMARALRVKPQWLDQVEDGQRPSADKIIQIFEASQEEWVRVFCLDLLRLMFPHFPWPVANGQHKDT